MASEPTLYKEFSIPFPGGYIAAKSWGNETGIPVLALHGWQDNLGTFDRLIPLLPNNLYIVAVDYIGHGLSSHKPPGTFYNYIEMIIEIKRVVDYLKWKRFNIMAHSLGGGLALIYGSLYPNDLISLICLDMIKPPSRHPRQLPESTTFTIQKLFQLESKLNNPAPVYSFDEARVRLMNGMSDSITIEAADILLQRGMKPSESGDGFVFTRDIRVQAVHGLQYFSHVDLEAYLSNFKSHLLVIIAENSKFYLSQPPQIVNDVISIYKTNCQSADFVKVKGNHFVHLNNPEIVAPHVIAFFLKYGRLTGNL